MPYIPVTKDLSRIKTKVLFNLTKRQLICFGSGAALGIPIFFVLKSAMSSSTSTFIMILTMLPFFIFAIYEKNGQTLEKILRNVIITRFFRPKHRPYRTSNFYAVIARQNMHEKEVSTIVKQSASTSNNYETTT